MGAGWIQTVLQESLGLQPGESLLILADRPLWAAGEALGAAAAALGAGKVQQMALPDPGVLFSVVPRSLPRAAGEADVILTLRSGLNLQVEDAHIRAAMGAFRQEGHGRWASFAQVDAATLEGALGAGLGPVIAHAEELAGQMRAARGVHLTSASGTDLRLSYARRPVQVENGLLRVRGAVGNLPAGEVYVAPHEAQADGHLVVDLALGDIWLDEPVTLTFEHGRVVHLSGGRAASELRSRLGNDDWAWTIGEFGLGANPHLGPTGKVALDEKALGTAHIALGGNRSFGGANPAATHYDCVIRAPQVKFLK